MLEMHTPEPRQRYLCRIPIPVAKALNLLTPILLEAQEEAEERIRLGGLRYDDLWLLKMPEMLVLGGFTRQLHWAREMCHTEHIGCIIPQDAHKIAATLGHISMVRWIMQNDRVCIVMMTDPAQPWRGLEAKHVPRIYADAVRTCIESGRILDLDRYERCTTIRDDLIDTALLSENIELLNWFLIRKGANRIANRLCHMTLAVDCKVWAWVIERMPYTAQADTFYRAAQYGRIAMVKTMYEVGVAYDRQQALEVADPQCAKYIKSLPLVRMDTLFPPMEDI